MSKIGFYRHKLENATSQTVALYINGVAAKTKQVIAKEVCTGFRQLKWLDNNGQYRFYPFVVEHGIKNTPNEIGTTNEIISSLLTNRTDNKSIGYNAERTITLHAKNVSIDELEILSGIYYSPRVYYYVGSGSTDDAKDWVFVSVKGDNIEKREKRNFGKVDITITLPKYYTVNTL